MLKNVIKKSSIVPSANYAGKLIIQAGGGSRTRIVVYYEDFVSYGKKKESCSNCQ